RAGAPQRERGLRLSSGRADVTRSAELFDRAKAVLPGGVNSPVRAFRAVGGTPFFVAQAHGACLTDVDGTTYLDYVCSWGPLILGHAHPAVLDAIRHAVERGWSYGAPCPAEVELAELVRQRMPAVEMVRFVNSGTEATMAAVRLARAVRPLRVAADLRRGDDGLPGGARRRTAAARRASRPHHAREDHRRRDAGRRVRRTRRLDEDGRARGARIPGWHAFGEPRGDG